MARVFRHTYTKQGRGGKRVTVQTRKWYIEYRDPSGTKHRVAGYTDRQATEQLGAELERRAAREEEGLIDRFAEHRKRPLSRHLEDWQQAILAKGNTDKHAALSKARAQRVLDGCHFRTWSDIVPAKVRSFLADLRRDGMAAQTSNYHLQAAKSFCTWMVRDARAAASPLTTLQPVNARTDRRHERRPLSAKDLRELLAAAQFGPVRRGMPGPQRAMLYRVWPSKPACAPANCGA